MMRMAPSKYNGLTLKTNLQIFLLILCLFPNLNIFDYIYLVGDAAIRGSVPFFMQRATEIALASAAQFS
jgi:hypothetical protein